MNTFFAVAAVMAAIASSAVAIPLIVKRQRMLGAIAAFCMAATAAGLYTLWSNWDWQAPVQTRARAASPDVIAMVNKLEKHLNDEPNDQTGWLLLGRSYLTLERLDDAVLAYDHAYRLGKSAEAALGLGEAMSLRAGGEITAPAAELFEEGLALAPSNAKALLYGGFAAAMRGERELARSRWQALKDMHPPKEIESMLEARIAELGVAAPVGTKSSVSGTNTSPGATGSARVDVNISIAPALKSRLRTEARLFVFAREPGGGGPPLAAKRLTSAAIGTEVHLSEADSMLPGRVLTGGQRVSITARVSFSGQPTPAAGDLYGELTYEVGRDGVRDLVIDRVAK